MKRISISKATFGEIHLCSTEAQIWRVWLQQILWLCANISPIKIIKTFSGLWRPDGAKHAHLRIIAASHLLHPICFDDFYISEL